MFSILIQAWACPKRAASAWRCIEHHTGKPACFESTLRIIAAVLADDVLGRLVQQPGSLLGALHAALRPVAASIGSWSAASQALRDLAKHKGLQKQLQALHLGRLLLRYSRMVFPGSPLWSMRYGRKASEAQKIRVGLA